MGGSNSTMLSEEQLSEYQELTYFTQKEILHCYTRFRAFNPKAIDMNLYAKVQQRKILELPELRVNPFRDRICKVFSSSKDGNLTFEDFLDMMSVFSEYAPKYVKTEYAFRVYDFNEDGYICKKDMKRIIDRLCGSNRLSIENVLAITDNIIAGGDYDEDGKLSYAEFEGCIQRAPDFINSFRIRL